MKNRILMAVAFLAMAAVTFGQVNSRQIKNSLAFYQSHLKRLIWAVGPDTVMFTTDFTGNDFHDAGAASDPVGWTTTVVEVGAGTTEFDALDGSGGFARITTAANENDGGSYQLLGEAYELTSDQVLYVGAFGVQLNDATQTDFFIGLAVTDTAILGGVTDRIGFEKLDAATDLKFAVEKDSTQTLTASLATMADTTAVDIEFYFDGTNLEVFVNGASVATPAVTNLPDNEAMRVSIEFLSGEAVANTFELDRLTVIQIGR